MGIGEKISELKLIESEDVHLLILGSGDSQQILISIPPPWAGGTNSNESIHNFCIP